MIKSMSVRVIPRIDYAGGKNKLDLTIWNVVYHVEAMHL